MAVEGFPQTDALRGREGFRQVRSPPAVVRLGVEQQVRDGMRQPERGETPAVGGALLARTRGVFVAAGIGQHPGRGEQMEGGGPGMPLVEKQPRVVGVGRADSESHPVGVGKTRQQGPVHPAPTSLRKVPDETGDGHDEDDAGSDREGQEMLRGASEARAGGGEEVDNDRGEGDHEDEQDEHEKPRGRPVGPELAISAALFQDLQFLRGEGHHQGVRVESHHEPQTNQLKAQVIRSAPARAGSAATWRACRSSGRTGKTR